MTLTWYEPPTPSADDLPSYLEHLHPLGVRWRSPWPAAPDVTYQVRGGQLLAEVGAVTVTTSDQVIDVWPYRGIGVREQLVLAGTAQRAFEVPPTKRDGWAYSMRAGRPRWVTFVHVPVTDPDGLESLVARHHQRMTLEALTAVNAAPDLAAEADR